MTQHKIVSPSDWLAARKALLAKEKEFTRARDALSAARRELPWVKIDNPYAFDTNAGRKTLADLFENRSQLIVYHFMFHPDWNTGCKSCSFWADNFNNIIQHLNQRDVTMIAISRGPLAKLNAFKKRMGWDFEWVSSAPCEFNFDFGVSFTPATLKSGGNNYNFGTKSVAMEELPGLSVFCKDADGALYRTYSTYARGLDMLNAAYHHLDLVPKGRDEAGLPYGMAWVKLHDEYAAS